jgi:transcriptional regulator with XRE-family HTH domain
MMVKRFCAYGAKDSLSAAAPSLCMARPRKAGRPRPLPPTHFLKEWRDYRGLTQDQLARLLGLSEHSQVSKYESGETKLTYLRLLQVARVLRLRHPGELWRDPLDQSSEWALADRIGRLSADGRETIETVLAALEKKQGGETR